MISKKKIKMKIKTMILTYSVINQSKKEIKKSNNFNKKFHNNKFPLKIMSH